MSKALHAFVGVAIAIASGALFGDVARAEDETLQCVARDSSRAAILRRLRQLSLDLQGRAPTIEEVQRVLDASDLELGLEDEFERMLASEEYLRTMRGHHRSLLWGNLDTVDLVAAQRTIVQLRGTEHWSVRFGDGLHRGKRDLRCLDQEQRDFDADGRPIPIRTFREAECRFDRQPDEMGTCYQEGWVRVNPYWAPDTEIKVCAFDAQPNQGCDPNTNDRRCGCGSDLRHCTSAVSDAMIKTALIEEPLRILDSAIRDGRSYLDVLTDRATVLNGPAAHFYKYLTDHGGVRDQDRVAVAADMESIPDLSFQAEDEWVPAMRGPSHAGPFTTFAYMMRFNTNRARASRFFTAFYCSPFIPSEGGVPAEEAEPNPNLRERDGCASCHTVLEPAAAHWARWRTGTDYGFFGNTMSFQQPRQECFCGPGTDEAQCSNFCNEYYVTADNSHEDEYQQFGARPLARAWLEDSDWKAVDDGPKALMDNDAERLQVAECVIKNLAQHLYGRPIQEGEQRWLRETAAAFANEGYNFTSLVRRLVNEPTRYLTVAQ